MENTIVDFLLMWGIIAKNMETTIGIIEKNMETTVM